MTVATRARNVARVCHRSCIALIACLLASWALPGAAQPPVVQTQGDVRFVSGGIGLGERLDLAAMHAEFNVFMTFAVKRAGNFIADVAVRVENADGQVLLDAVSQGPWFYARLAPGRYRLHARYAGVAQAREFRVRAGRHTELTLYWDDPAARENLGAVPDRAPPAERRQ